MKKQVLCILLLFSTPLFFTGCFFTSQSYNHGKLLNPGESLITLGVGLKTFPRMNKAVSSDDNYYYNDTSSTPIEVDSALYRWVTLCIDYRLGFLAKYPFGKGMEIGCHIEQMLASITGVYQEKKHREAYPPTNEITCRFGFKDITLRKSIFHHNIALGWIIGLWIDNGWLAEYATGWEFEKVIPYISVRSFLKPTDALKKMDEGISVNEQDDSFWQHDFKLNFRVAGGASVKLPERIVFLPDYISPEVSLTFPNSSFSKRCSFSMSIGMRWLNGI